MDIKKKMNDWKLISFFFLFFLVKNLLTDLGLDRYINVFFNEEIDFEALCMMNENHLKNIGVPQGPRLKILNKIAVLQYALES